MQRSRSSSYRAGWPYAHACALPQRCFVYTMTSTMANWVRGDRGDLRADLLDHDVHGVPDLAHKPFLHRGQLCREVRGEVRGELWEILLGDWLVLVEHHGTQVARAVPSDMTIDREGILGPVPHGHSH